MNKQQCKSWIVSKSTILLVVMHKSLPECLLIQFCVPIPKLQGESSAGKGPIWPKTALCSNGVVLCLTLAIQLSYTLYVLSILRSYLNSLCRG